MKKIKKLQLYKIELEANYNRNLAPRTEYIKTGISRTELLKSVTGWCKISSTEYYGYTKIEITASNGIPEIMSITIHKGKKK